MVKVISPATEKEVSCHKCGTRLAYTYHDVQSGLHTDYGGGRDYYKYIICPVCISKVTVNG